MGEVRVRKMFLFVRGVETPVSTGDEFPLMVIFGGGVVGRESCGVVGEVVKAPPMSCTRRRAVKMSSSVKRLKGSKLLRMVPVKRVGS